MALLAPSDGPFRELAERLSAERDEAVYEAVDAVPDGEPVVCVAPPDLDEERMFALQRRLLEAGPDGGGFSIVTGRSAAQAEDLYYRESDRGDGHAVLMNEGPELAADPEASVFVRNDMTADNLRAAEGDGLHSLTLQSGGWPIHVRLAEGYVCGFPPDGHVDLDGPAPYCVEDGERNCPLADEGDLVFAESLDAAHVFVVSCASMTDNGTCDSGIHVGMGLLENAASLIGSYRPGVHQPFESLLHYSLARAGYDVVERCYLLNRNSHVNDVMSYPYVPFGRPEAAPNATPSTFEYAFEDGEEGLDVRFADVDTHLIDVTIPADRAPAGDDRPYVIDVGDYDGENTLYYSAFDEDEGIRLLLYTGSRIEADEIRVRVSREPYAADRRAMAAASVANAEENEIYGITTDAAGDRVEHLRPALESVQRQEIPEGYDAGAWRKTDQQLQSLFGNVDSVRDELLDLFDGGQRVKVEYLRKAITADVYPTDWTCDDCGRRLFMKQLTYPSAAADRALSLCPQCGSDNFDVPTGTDEVTFPTIRGDLVESTDDVREFTVEFENVADHPTRATVHPTVWHVGEETADGERLVEPRFVEERLEPGERLSAEFSLDTSLLGDNQHYLLCRVLDNLAVYSRSALVQVGEKRSHVHPRYQG